MEDFIIDQEIRYCECGCGAIVRNRFVFGHVLIVYRRNGVPQSVRDKISKAHTGKVFTEEHKQNIRLKTKEAWSNPDLRKRQSDSHKGRKFTDDWKKHLSESALARGLGKFYGKSRPLSE